MTSACNPLARLALLAATVSCAVPAAAGDAPAPRHLLVDVRDTPPQRAGGIRHGADNSYSVSTGGGDRDERPDAPDNATTVSTGNSVRRVHIVEGERVRVDLPAVQSLQFHVPIPGAASAKPSGAAPARGGAAAATGGTTTSGATGTTGSTPGPSVSGIVSFSAVTAFAARFAVTGSTVRVELTPLQAGSVSAPYGAGGAGSAPAKVTVQGRVGQWIALGDTELSSPGASLNATPEPVQPASVWVRVQPEPADTAE